MLPSLAPGLWLVHLASSAPSWKGCGAGTRGKRTVLACLLLQAAHSSPFSSSTLITVWPPPSPPLCPQRKGSRVHLGVLSPVPQPEEGFPSLLGDQEGEATEGSLRITDCIVRGQSPQGPQEGCPYLGTGEVWEGPWAVLRQCPGKGQGSYLAGLPMDGRLWGPPSSWSCPTPAPAGLPAATTLSTSLTPEGRFPICEGRGVIDLRGGGDVFWAFQGGLELFS